MVIDETERGFRRGRFEQLVAEYRSSDDLEGALAERDRIRDEARPALNEIVDRFFRTRDVNDFKGSMDSWSRNRPHFGFGGPNGAMFLNQLVNDGDEQTTQELLARLLQPPTDEDGARAAIAELVDYAERLRERGSAAAVGRVPFFLSWFWWNAEPLRWPVLWPNAERGLIYLGFIADVYPWPDQAERYVGYRAETMALGEFGLVEQVLSWVGRDEPMLGLGTSAMDRTNRAAELVVELTEDSTPEDETSYGLNATNIAVLLAEMKYIGRNLADDIAEVLGNPVKNGTPGPFWIPRRKRLRRDAWAEWRPVVDGPTAQLRLSLSERGVAVGLYAYHVANGPGYAQAIVDVLRDRRPAELEWLPFGSGAGDPTEMKPSAVLLGRQIPLAVATVGEELRREVLDVVRLLRPSFEASRTAAAAAPPATRAPMPGGGDLASLRELFLQGDTYPGPEDARHLQARDQMAALLARDVLPALAVEDFRKMYNSGDYGGPGPQSILNSEIRDGGEATYERLLKAIDFVLWEESIDAATRIDRVLDESDLGVRGFKESVIMKLLSIARPGEFLPIFPYSGDRGKAAVLKEIGRPSPPLALTPGERQVASNDELRKVGEELFPGDTWGQKQFFYWLLSRGDLDEEATEVEGVDTDVIGDLADELYLDSGFLQGIVGLLEAHRQVVFYGPPGTGKTYVALKLAEALAPLDQQRAVVQFHPSTSYEDFFEGYRPDPDSSGAMRYKLAPGPLRLMAEAANSSNKPHILVIDEINRADLAKVLGELLFLLEYRGTQMTTLYRPDEPFMLPENLWIIGTMNTADRSIALVDAALRRRFQFVPFIPDDREENPIGGLLRRWAGPDLAWIADLVDAVNQQLRKDLGGDHLLLGPSYFMRDGLDEEELRRVWRFQIEPLIDDLFFGEPERFKQYRFEAVWARHGPDQVPDTGDEL